MTAYRPRLFASLAVLAVGIAFLAGSLLLRPRPASAASAKLQRSLFGPTFVRDGHQIFVQYANTTTRTTPPWNVGVFLQDGRLLDSGTVNPVPPRRDRQLRVRCRPDRGRLRDCRLRAGDERTGHPQPACRNGQLVRTERDRGGVPRRALTGK